MGDVYDLDDEDLRDRREKRENSISREASRDAQTQYDSDLAAVRRANKIADEAAEVKAGRVEEENESGEYDPLDGGSGTSIALLITMMRLYDVGLAILSESNDKLAEQLIKTHEAGSVVASYPNLSLE